MALHHLIAPDDCIEQYEKAAGEKHESGFLLLGAGYASGVEPLAFSVEMVLKASYFRLIGYAPTRSIGTTDLRDAERDIQSLGVSHPAQSFHNLEFWAEGLIALHGNGLPARSYGGRSYPAILAQPMQTADADRLRQCAARLMTNWNVSDRYKAVQPHANKQDLEAVFDDALGIASLYDEGRI